MIPFAAGVSYDAAHTSAGPVPFRPPLYFFGAKW